MRNWHSTMFALFTLFLAACSDVDVNDGTTETAPDQSSRLPKIPTPIDSRIEQWAPGTVRVEAVVYDCQEGRAGNHHAERPLVVDGEKHPFIVETQTKDLSADQVTQLASLLTDKHKPREPAYCYVPHHGFLFYRADGTVGAHVEICLLCAQGVSSPSEGLAKNWDYPGLKSFIVSIGLPAFKSVKDWEDYFANNHGSERSTAPQF